MMDTQLSTTNGASTARRATATLLLTDIEGSCVLWERQPKEMAEALERHDRTVARVVSSHDGRLLKARGEGDSAFVVFEAATSAVNAAVELQQTITETSWSTAEPLRVRIGVSTGDVVDRDNDILGLAIARARRIRGLARGGEIVLGAATAAIVLDTVPDGAELVDLGLRELRGLRRPEHVFQLRTTRPDGCRA
jgi:class 3 adenylate cyclase